MLKTCSEILQNPEMTVFIEKMISSALDAADSREAVRDALKVRQGSLQIKDAEIQLTSNCRIRVVAIGKAALNMAAGAIDMLGYNDIGWFGHHQNQTG